MASPAAAAAVTITAAMTSSGAAPRQGLTVPAASQSFPAFRAVGPGLRTQGLVMRPPASVRLSRSRLSRSGPARRQLVERLLGPAALARWGGGWRTWPRRRARSPRGGAPRTHAGLPGARQQFVGRIGDAPAVPRSARLFSIAT